MDKSPTEATLEDASKLLDSEYKDLSLEDLAVKAVDIATLQIQSCWEFKRARLMQLAKYWELYDGKTKKKLRQLFNVPIPVFPGMIDTLNAQYDTPIQLTFKEGDAADYFKVLKVNGAFRKEVMNTTTNSKWDKKLRMCRKHAIMNGVGVMEYSATSDPEYKSTISNIKLKDFNFQPRGGAELEDHLFAGTEDVEMTKSDLAKGAKSGYYNMAQVKKLVRLSNDKNYLPASTQDTAIKLARFKPLGLNPDNNTYVGQTVYKLVNHILTIDGQRYYICFHPWTKTWLRFEKWTENGGLYPWMTYATHEDDENFLSKSFSDDLYAAADAIVAMFNQELTNREKRNFGARAYDEEMFKDVRKLDDAMHRPDALVPANTKGGTKQIAQGIYEFKTGELQGTVNLIDWITGTVGRNTGANDLAMGSVQDVSKKASVTFAEQKSISKRLGWGAQPFQGMMAALGERYLWGLKDHMPSTMAIRIMGEAGWDWDEITRLDLDTTKDIDVIITASDQAVTDSEAKAKKRADALELLVNSPNINGQKRDEEILRSVGEYEDAEVAEFMDVKTYSDRKSLAKASESINFIIRGQKPLMWFGADVAFIQKIVDYANDKRSTLGPKFPQLIQYAMSHVPIARSNIERKITEDSLVQQQQSMQAAPVDGAAGNGASALAVPQKSTAVNPGVSGGMSRAMSVAQSA